MVADLLQYRPLIGEVYHQNVTTFNLWWGILVHAGIEIHSILTKRTTHNPCGREAISTITVVDTELLHFTFLPSPLLLALVASVGDAICYVGRSDLLPR